MNKPITTVETDNYPSLHNTTTHTLTAIFIALCMAFVQQAQADNAARLVEIINYYGSVGSGGTGTLSAVASGNTVTVTGNVANATTYLQLMIDSDVTIVWRATLGCIGVGCVMLDDGMNGMIFGTFNMESGQISSTSADAIYYTTHTGTGALNISGGTVSSGRIYNSGTGALNISGGIVSGGIYNSGTGALNISGGNITSTIENGSSGKMTVSGASTKITSENTMATSGTIIMRNGTLEITGGTVENTYATGNIIYTTPTAGNTVNISGNITATTGTAVRHNGEGTLNITSGTISATTGTAIQNNNWAGALNITGGTISATAGTAIENAGTGKITVSGSSTKITSANVTATSGTIRLANGTLDITGGRVENIVSGVAIYNNNTGKITLSGNTEITSANTSATGGTIVLANSGNATDERLVIDRGDVYNNAAGGNAIYNASTGAVTIGARGYVEAQTGTGIRNNSSGTVNMNGEIYATTGTAVHNAGTGTVNITGGTASATTGRAIENSSTGKITVSGGGVESINTTATSGTIYLANGTLDITGGEVQNQSTNANARAVYNNGAGAVSISGGTVSAKNGYAIYKAGTGATALTGGAAYAWGTSGADVMYGSYTASSGNPVIIAWNQAAGKTSYTTLTSEHLFAAPSTATATWRYGTGLNGVNNLVYANGANTGRLNPNPSGAVTVVRITSPTPTGLTATYGQTLANVALPSGWAWTSAATTSVGNAGTRTHTASYTPTDLENYLPLNNISVSIEVAKANYDMSGIALIDAKATYNGEPHSIFINGTLPAGVTVAYTGNAQTELGAHTVTASFTGADAANYNTPAPMSATLTIVATPTYTVAVVGGIGSSSYEAGEEVEIVANAPPAGKTFDKWTSTDGIAFANASKESTAFEMPAKDVTVTATYKDLSPSTYSITVENNGHGTANANASSAAAGKEITLAAVPNEGYKFREWKVVSGGIAITGNKFTMPASNVVVMAVFEAEGTDPIRLPQIANSNIHAYATGSSIILQNLPANAKVEVFGLNGKLVYSNRGNPIIGGIGVQTIDVHAKGIYIVKIGNTPNTFRVAVK